MCARCFSSRRTNPFSAMICNIFSTVVYCVGLREQTHSCTWRTVAGPRLQSTVRISNSASVGRGSISAIYEELTTKMFVCQAEILAELGLLWWGGPRAEPLGGTPWSAADAPVGLPVPTRCRCRCSGSGERAPLPSWDPTAGGTASGPAAHRSED